MGVKRSKKSAPVETLDADADGNVALKDPPPADGSIAGPDAAQIDLTTLIDRNSPPADSARENRYQIIYRPEVLADIDAHGKTSMEAEVCGVLVGEVYHDASGPWTHVEHSIRGVTAVGKQTQVTFTAETWSHIHQTMDRDFPEKKILGWYHTHPGFGIFLSGMDLFIQENFFNVPWQIAEVYDPHAEEHGTFVWRGGKPVREAFLTEVVVAPAAPPAPEPPATLPSLFAPRGAAAVSEDGHALASANVAAATEPALPAAELSPPAAPVAAEFQASEVQTPDSWAMAKLVRRVETLERRLDRLMTGLLVLVLIALVAPLVVYIINPDVIRRLPAIPRQLLPSAPEPTTMPAPDVPLKGAAPHDDANPEGSSNSPAGGRAKAINVRK